MSVPSPSQHVRVELPTNIRPAKSVTSASVRSPWTLPDPSTRYVRTLALHVFEALYGTRSIAALSSAVSVAAARDLAAQRAVLRERETMYQETRREVAIPGRLHLCRTNERSAEAAVVLHMRHRANVLTFSFEWIHRRWRAEEIWLL